MQQNFLKNASIQAGAVIVIIAALTFISFRQLVLNWPVQRVLFDAVNIPNGATASKVASILKKRGFIESEQLFINAVRLKAAERHIKAGHFRLANIYTMRDLVTQIIYPRLDYIIFTIPEGLTRKQISSFINEQYPIDTTYFLSLSEDSDFIVDLGLNVPNLEGYLFPETYKIRNGDTEEDILAIMVGHLKTVLTDDITEEGKKINLTPHEILTMASIIEGEAKHDTERPLVAAVYHNRLEKGMRLQADPTIQYILPDGPRRLFYRDYEIDSPYNTYLNDGLPPGPVNNPGEASILAAVTPAEVDYLYFVADGSGYHIFTRTNEEHNAAKMRVHHNNKSKKNSSRQIKKGGFTSAK